MRKEKKDFFKKYKESLLENYPGLTEYIFLREFEEVKLSPIIQEKLHQGVPFAYINGKSYFYDREFIISEEVFIPRFETELLVTMALEEVASLLTAKERRDAREGKERRSGRKGSEGERDKSLNIVDLCTGSGAIGLSIAKNVKCSGVLLLTDTSFKAIELAKKNFEMIKNDSSLQVIFSLSEGTKLIPYHQDLIVSNPPYIPRSKAGDVHPNVLAFEPASALFIDDDAYELWFERFFRGVYEKLETGGVFLMEGHEDKLCDLKKLAEKLSFQEVEIGSDYTKRPRFLKARKISLV